MMVIPRLMVEFGRQSWAISGITATATLAGVAVVDAAVAAACATKWQKAALHAIGIGLSSLNVDSTQRPAGSAAALGSHHHLMVA